MTQDICCSRNVRSGFVGAAGLGLGVGAGGGLSRESPHSDDDSSLSFRSPRVTPAIDFA